VLGLTAITPAVAVPIRVHVGPDREFTADAGLEAAAKTVLDELARLAPVFATLRAAR